MHPGTAARSLSVLLAACTVTALVRAEIRIVSADVTAEPGKYKFSKAPRADRAGVVPSGENPTITLRPNDRILFRLEVEGHPMHIQSAIGTGSIWPVRGVANNGATEGVLEGAFPDAGVYYYHCTRHPGMYGVINVTLPEAGTADTKAVPNAGTPAPTPSTAAAPRRVRAVVSLACAVQLAAAARMRMGA